MYSIGTPATDLQPFIEHYWFVTCPPGQTYRLAVDVYVDAQADLVINYGVPYERVASDGSTVSVPFSSIDAQRRRPVQIRQDGHVQVCGVRFRAGGLAAFTGAAMNSLTDLAVPASDVLGRELHDLRAELERLRPNQEARIDALDEFFRGHRRDDAAYERFRALLATASSAGPGELSLTELAETAGISPRSVERLFARYLGLSPRFYLRVARFQRAINAMMDDTRSDLAGVALAAGYYDQSHLVREFRELAGGVPRQYKGYLPEIGRDFAPNVVRYSDPLRGHPTADDSPDDHGDKRVKPQIDED